jgi:hypothetical protein
VTGKKPTTEELFQQDLELEISNLLVSNHIKCDNVAFCRTPAFLVFYIAGNMVVAESAQEKSSVFMRRVITEKTPNSGVSFSLKIVDDDVRRLEQRAMSVRTYKLGSGGLPELLARKKSSYVFIYAHNGFWDDLEKGFIRMVTLYKSAI